MKKWGFWPNKNNFKSSLPILLFGLTAEDTGLLLQTDWCWIFIADLCMQSGIKFSYRKKMILTVVGRSGITASLTSLVLFSELVNIKFFYHFMTAWKDIVDDRVLLKNLTSEALMRLKLYRERKNSIRNIEFYAKSKRTLEDFLRSSPRLRRPLDLKTADAIFVWKSSRFQETLMKLCR